MCYTEARIRTRYKGKSREIINSLGRYPYNIHRSNQSTFCDNPKNARSQKCRNNSYHSWPSYHQRKTRRQIRNKRRNKRKQRKQTRHLVDRANKPKKVETASHFETSHVQPKLNQFADTFKEWSDRYTDYHLRISTGPGDRISVDSSKDELDYNPDNLVCPTVPHYSTVHCSPKYSVDQCWVPDRPDSDCANNDLCCFDGCRNVCFSGVPEPESDEEEYNDDRKNSYNGGSIRYSPFNLS